LAKSYNDLINKYYPALIYMDIQPKYPGNDPKNPRSYRPEWISVNCKIITLKENSNSLKIEENPFPDRFSNPEPVVSEIVINSADITQLIQVFRREFADIILAEKNRNGDFADEHDFIWRISFQLGQERQIQRIINMLASREHLISI